MWGLIIQGAILVGVYAYHRWVEDHPGPPPPDRNLELPRVSEGTPIALVYGRCRIRQPILVWSGNFLAPGDKYTNVTGDEVEADHYSLDTMFILGAPFFGGNATFISAWAGDSRIRMEIDPSEGTTQGYRGGDGGFGANGDDSVRFSVFGVFYQGSNVQDVTSGLASGPAANRGGEVFPDGVAYGTSYKDTLEQNSDDVSLVPGMRHQIALFSHVALGLSPSFPSLSFEVQSLSTGTASDMGQSMPTDADPIAVVHDLLTSKWGKLALPAENIDLPSFAAASLTLFGEGHGYSRAIEQSEDAMSIINDVMRQIDAAWYVEPTTSKIVIKLIRKDFNPGDLDNINPDNARPTGPGWLQIQGWSETMNQVRVSYTNRADSYADGIAIGQDGSNAVAQGGKLRSANIRFVGCSNNTLACKLASRELAVVSRPIVKATMIVNRGTAYQHRPGDAITLSWPKLGISRMVMRIARMNLGQIDKSEIEVDLIRDVSDASTGAFPVP